MINRKIKEEIERLKNRVEVLEFLRENPSGFGVFHAVKLGEIPVWMVEEFYKNVGLQPEVIANAVLYAVSQPDNVDVSDLGVRPSLEI